MCSQACVKNSVHEESVSQHTIGQTSPPPPHILHIILQIITPQTSLFTDNSFEIHFETEPDTAADVFHNHFHYQYSP